MKPTPEGWPRVCSALFYEDANAAIEWLCRAFGFEVRTKLEGEGGRIQQAELVFADGMLLVASRRGLSDAGESPRAVGGANTQMVCIHLDDVDAHFRRAKAAGAKIVIAPNTEDRGEQYPSTRSYQVEDGEGHRFLFMQRIRDRKWQVTWEPPPW